MSPRRSSADGPVGMAVVDKEPGMTSHDVVARCRRIFGERRVGHAGTLDPDATGVLLVGVGRFTRVLRFLAESGKAYVGEVVLGISTTTLDASGEVTGSWDMSGVDLLAVADAARRLTGTIEQVPPMVSAVKVGGRRLHELARAGTVVERAPRPVTVDRFDVTPVPGEPGVLRIDVECSAGTYIRVLADDLGRLLGGGAHLRRLRRTRVGTFSVGEATTLAELGPEHLLTPVEAARDLERLDVDAAVASQIGHGAVLERHTLAVTGPGPYAVVGPSGLLLAVYEERDATRLGPACVLEPQPGPGRSGGGLVGDGGGLVGGDGGSPLGDGGGPFGAE